MVFQQGRATKLAKTHGEYFALQLQDIRWAKACKNSTGDERVVRMMQDLIAAMCSLNLDRESATKFEKVGEDVQYEDGMVKDLEDHPLLGRPDVQIALDNIMETLPVGAKKPTRDVGQILASNYEVAYDALYKAVQAAHINIRAIETGTQKRHLERSEYAVSGTSLPSSISPGRHAERSPYAFEGTSLPSGSPSEHPKRSEYAFEGTILPDSG
ncbi:uncharacterized protein PV09_09072 [Verruconis gallopava]|uniref:Uncharacterized protein n=1 Tax=Verruconis gallopava TaxID=253628 RepID=A0A0D2AJT7_9PEZI|nr:uncharacterized protein PV09_09072 [Verruconis gallopava]KIV99208.1 hypothetical protein PV09_09072 [Verruconis gallopava]